MLPCSLHRFPSIRTITTHSSIHSFVNCTVQRHVPSRDGAAQDSIRRRSLLRLAGRRRANDRPTPHHLVALSTEHSCSHVPARQPRASCARSHTKADTRRTSQSARREKEANNTSVVPGLEPPLIHRCTPMYVDSPRQVLDLAHLSLLLGNLALPDWLPRHFSGVALHSLPPWSPSPFLALFLASRPDSNNLPVTRT